MNRLQRGARSNAPTVRQEQAENLVTQCPRDQEVEARMEEVSDIWELLDKLSDVETKETASPDRSVRECLPMELSFGFGRDRSEKRDEEELVRVLKGGDPERFADLF